MDLLIWPNSDTFPAIIAVLCIINSVSDVWQWYLALIESFIVQFTLAESSLNWTLAFGIILKTLNQMKWF